jgi:serine/threonine protein kinase
MARVIQSPSGGGPVNDFERQVIHRLQKELPETYSLIPNFQLKQKTQGALEYDVVVLAPHGICVVEAKAWYGKLVGDDNDWELNGKPKKNPLWLANTKCKVLKSELGPLGNVIRVEPLLVLPENISVLLGGGWASHVRNLPGAPAWVGDKARFQNAQPISPHHEAILKALLGRALARNRGQAQRIGGYQVVETLEAGERFSEYLARRAFVPDPSQYRVRVWRLDQSGSFEDVKKRKAIISRPSEAVAKIGKHRNLLPVLQFDFLEDSNEFFEVTEWSEYGTLRAVLKPGGPQLTVRERLEIAQGIASGLEAVHAHGVVHRNMSPASVLIGFDRRPLLTDFDRAYVEAGQTVYPQTQRASDPAFVPPELKDAANYDFDAASDMYSVGAIIYLLLVGEVPFANADAAVAAGGKPPKRISSACPGLGEEIDELVDALVNVTDFQARPSAAAVVSAIQTVLTDSSGEADAGSVVPALSSPTPEPPKFEVGAVVGPWRVDEKLGGGAFSTVYRVFNLDQMKPWAMKLLNRPEDFGLLQHEYTRISDKLPAHPNISKPIWLERLPDGRPYIVSEFVEGETLEAYCSGKKSLPWSEIQRIGAELLDALAAIHPVALHRDIKPANILLQFPTNTAKLIDFNIAAIHGEAEGRGGTPRYWAPDRGQPEWRPDMDLFSLGVVLYELVNQQHPFPQDNPEKGTPHDPRELRRELGIDKPLAEFLLKAVQPAGRDRFSSAEEMKRALLSVRFMHAPASGEQFAPGVFPGVTLEPGEATHKNYNPYVTRLLTLYSQARRTNAGTRGLDDIARLTYVPTRLDNALAPHIADGRFRLVVVSGNAGDGKTAFLQNTEKFFASQGATLVPLATRNGSRWHSRGLDFETNWDGSQDEGDRTNDEVLAAFLAPFEGPVLNVSGKQVRLIAINEGRLIDFLLGRHGDRFAGLRAWALPALQGRGGAEHALLVNLNERAVTSGGQESLLERQLIKMLAPELWAPCTRCDLRGRCPLKHNADTLSDPISGPAVRARVRRLFEVVHLRRRMHITMRDLRSALSWLLLRDHGCEDVSRLLVRKDDQVRENLADLYYPEAFAHPEAEEAGSQDRLVRLLRDTDVGFVNEAALDRRLDHNPDTAVPWTKFEDRSEHAVKVMDALTRGVPLAGAGEPLPALLEQRRSLVARWRRWAYFERQDEAWPSMLPYRSLPLLENVARASPGPARDAAALELRDRVLEAISTSEGMRNAEARRRWLALRVSRVKSSPVRSYRLFPRDGFRVFVADEGCMRDYLEFEPDAVEVRGVGAAQLLLSLDLLEMLELVRSGYRPTVGELQGLFVNLSIFRNELMSVPFHQVLVTPDDIDLYEVSAEGRPEGIHLKLERHTQAQGEA